MSYQPPSGPPRSTPIPGDSYSPAADQFNQAPPTPSAFLGGQSGPTGPTPHQHPGQPYAQQPYVQQPYMQPTIAYPKRKRSWGGTFFGMIIVLMILGGVGAGAWAVWKGISAANDATKTAEDLTNPDLSGDDIESLDIEGPEEFLYEGEAAGAVATALDAAIPGEPTQFSQILVYSDYAIATAQDPTTPGRFDQYIWRSGSVGAASAQPDDPTAKTFTIDQVNWTAITALAADAPRLTNVSEVNLTYIIVSTDAFDEAAPLIVRIYVTGPRSSAVVEATPQGEVIRTF